MKKETGENAFMANSGEEEEIKRNLKPMKE